MASPDLPYRAWWDEPHDVVWLTWAAGSRCGLPEAVSSVQAVLAVRPGRLRLLVDMRHLSTLDRAARTYYADPPGQFDAVALLVDSAVSKVVANFFIAVQNLRVPTKMFTEVDPALTWLGERHA